MIIKKPTYRCTSCKYKTSFKLRKMIHEQTPGHTMHYSGCQKRKIKDSKVSQKFDM
jgi:hypothetical protein